MSNWQERITEETAPAVRVEHDLRYACAAPLILSAGAWVDLGCGNGIAAAGALGERRPANAILVDLEPSAVENAAAELGLADAKRISGDLTDPALLGEIASLLRSLPAPATITCFEVVEHLHSFLPLVAWAVELVEELDATFVLSVPNDAFWATQNPHHTTSWGIGAFAELTPLLPSERTLLMQISLASSAVVDWEAGAVEQQLHASLDTENAVASHFLLAFGSRHEQVGRGALALQADAEEQRRWERERDSQRAQLLAVLDEHREVIAKQDARIVEQTADLRRMTGEFEQWRTYIHELESELNRPLSGVDQDAGAPADAP